MALSGLNRRLRRNSRSSKPRGLQQLQQSGVGFNSMAPRRAAQLAKRQGFNVTAQDIIDARTKMANTTPQQQGKVPTAQDLSKLQEQAQKQLAGMAGPQKATAQDTASKMGKMTPGMQQKMLSAANAKAATVNKASLSNQVDVGTVAAQAQSKTAKSKPTANTTQTQTQGMAKGGYTQRWAEARKKNK